MSWMQKLRDAKTSYDPPDLVLKHLEEFLDHFHGRSVWTETMIPSNHKGPISHLTVKVIKGPDKTKVAQGVHVHYVLAQRLIMFRIDTFVEFLQAKGIYDMKERLIRSELRRPPFKAMDCKARMFRGTPWRDAHPWSFVMIQVPVGSSLERQLFGENSPAVQSAMQAFETALARRREREARRRASK